MESKELLNSQNSYKFSLLLARGSVVTLVFGPLYVNPYFKGLLKFLESVNVFSFDKLK
jgi:hypothetical protein